MASSLTNDKLQVGSDHHNHPALSPCSGPALRCLSSSRPVGQSARDTCRDEAKGGQGLVPASRSISNKARLFLSPTPSSFAKTIVLQLPTIPRLYKPSPHSPHSPHSLGARPIVTHSAIPSIPFCMVPKSSFFRIASVTPQTREWLD